MVIPPRNIASPISAKVIIIAFLHPKSFMRTVMVAMQGTYSIITRANTNICAGVMTAEKVVVPATVAKRTRDASLRRNPKIRRIPVKAGRPSHATVIGLKPSDTVSSHPVKYIPSITILPTTIRGIAR